MNKLTQLAEFKKHLNTFQKNILVEFIAEKDAYPYVKHQLASLLKSTMDMEYTLSQLILELEDTE